MLVQAEGERRSLAAEDARQAALERQLRQEQRALDVAARWAASRAGTVDEELATKYAEALAAIARRQPPKKSSGGDGGAEPPRNKHHC